jgi:MYXO-CTERM domain-containing protein
MYGTRVRAAACLFVLAISAVEASRARAYCRETTGLAPQDGCDCSFTGLPLFWQQQPIPYALNEQGFPGVSDKALRAVLARSFAHWTEVSCDGEPILLSVKQLAETTAMTKEYASTGPNLSVFTHLSGEAFRAMGGDPHAFAVTSTAEHDSTGEIVDADTVFNGGLGPFVICPDTGCPDDSVDIENVATHEMGHFLGLAHSKVPDSTMECSAEKGELKMRSLEADDEAGICAIYSPPAIEEREEALHPRHTPPGCACRVSQTSHSAYAASLGALSLAAFLILRRRRQR